MKKNPHDRILKEKSREQHLSTVSRKVLYQEEGGKENKNKKQKKYYQIYWGTKKNILYFPMAKRTQEQKLNSLFLLTQEK